MSNITTCSPITDYLTYSEGFANQTVSTQAICFLICWKKKSISKGKLTFEARRLTESPVWFWYSGLPGQFRVFIVYVPLVGGVDRGNWLKGISWQESPPIFKRQQMQTRPNLLKTDCFIRKHYRISLSLVEKSTVLAFLRGGRYFKSTSINGP